MRSGFQLTTLKCKFGVANLRFRENSRDSWLKKTEIAVWAWWPDPSVFIGRQFRSIMRQLFCGHAAEERKKKTIVFFARKFYCFFCCVEKNTYFCKTPKGGNLNMIITSGGHRMAVNVKAERVGLSFPRMLIPVLMPSSSFFETVKMTLYGRKLTLLQ